MELSGDAKNFRLYVTPLCTLDGWSHPVELVGETNSSRGLPMPLAGYEALNLEWIDTGTYFEIIEFYNAWLADAASYLIHNKGCDLFFMHNHIPDYTPTIPIRRRWTLRHLRIRPKGAVLHNS